MSIKDKLIDRFVKMPTDYHYDEVVKLLGHFGYNEIKKGKTSGSRVKFENEDGLSVLLHKPHPDGIMKQYQLKQLKEFLDL